MSRPPDEILRWLMVGFDALASDNLEARRSAFAPLDLAPDRDLLAQLATMLREAEHSDYGSTKRLRRIVRERLRQPTVVTDESPAHLNALWRLLGGINPPTDVCGDARVFLNELLMLSNSESAFSKIETTTELVDAIVGCVAASKPASAAQIAFMRFLRTKKRVWSSRYLETFLDCAFSEVACSRFPSPGETERRIEAWCNLRTELSDDLGKRADPETPAGRSLLRSIARYVGIAVGEASDARNTSQLRNALWQLNCELDELVLAFERTETLEEAFA